MDSARKTESFALKITSSGHNLASVFHSTLVGCRLRPKPPLFMVPSLFGPCWRLIYNILVVINTILVVINNILVVINKILVVISNI